MPCGAQRLSSRIRVYRNELVLMCLLIAVLALTGCGLFPFSKKDENPPPATAPDVTQSAEFAGFSSIPVPTNSLAAAGPLQLEPGGSLGALGLNLDTYFTGDVEDTDERIERVERVVVAIQRDLKTLAPPIQRLLYVERDIQALVTQLTELTHPPALPPPQAAFPPEVPRQAHWSPPGTGGPGQPVPTAQPPTTPHVTGGATAPAATGSSVTVNRLRLGEHQDKTRIVLDVSGPATYRYDLDNGENLLVIELPDAGWSGPTQWQSDKSPLLSSYAVYTANGGGSRIVIQLKKGTEVAYETVIKGDGTNDDRIVLDLKK